MNAIGEVDRTIVETDALTPMPLGPLSRRPLVSVIIANYNYGRFLCNAVDSVFAQTYSNWELIICDDGSVDASNEVIRDLATKDSRIKALFKENGGQASAWNLAFSNSKGDIICVLDADDLYLPTKLEKVVDAFTQYPGAGIANHRFQVTDLSDKAVGTPQPDVLETGWLANIALRRGGVKLGAYAANLCVRREVASELFPIPCELRGFGDAYVQGLAQFITCFAAIPDVLYVYRIHGNNQTGMSYVEPLHAFSTNAGIAAMPTVFRHQKRYLCNRFGAEFSKQLRLEDNWVYVELLCAKYIIEGKPSVGVGGHSVHELHSMLPNDRRKLLWALLYRLPSFISRRLLHVWRSDAAWKRLVRPLANFLGLRKNVRGAL